jgi:beta-glucosidase
VLFGQAEPAGRLAYGIVESELDIPDIDMNAKSARYDRFWGYRLQQQKETRPAFPFGFGLGYGQVELVTGKTEILKNLGERFFEVGVTVRNQGENKSSDVIQIYGGKADQLGSQDYQRVLLGFVRTRYLEQGESETLKVKCRLDPIARWDKKDKRFVVTQGSYRISVAKHERDEQSYTQEVWISQIAWSARTELKQEV